MARSPHRPPTSGPPGPPGPPDPPDPDVLADAAEVFQLLGTPGRLHLLWLLATGEVDVTTLARAVGGTKAAISQHLAKLRMAGWVDARRDGRRVLYRATDPQVLALVEQAIAHVLDDRAASRTPRGQRSSGNDQGSDPAGRAGSAALRSRRPASGRPAKARPT